jgi:hypothetical protein
MQLYGQSELYSESEQQKRGQENGREEKKEAGEAMPPCIRGINHRVE